MTISKWHAWLKDYATNHLPEPASRITMIPELTTEQLDQMSYGDIAADIKHRTEVLGEDTPLDTQFMHKIICRLYEIGYFDNHVDVQDRFKAQSLLKSLQEFLRESLKSHDDSLVKMEKGWKVYDDAIPKNGYGSLAWLICENQISDEIDLKAFVKMPAHEPLLQNFKAVVGDEVFSEIMA